MSSPSYFGDTSDAPDFSLGGGAPAAAAQPVAPQPIAPQPATDHLQNNSWSTKVYHSILDGLAGKFDTQYIPTENGVIRDQVAQTPGQQWKRIIGAAVMGLGGAAAAGTTGPGGTMRGLGGGIQAGYQERMAEDKRNQEQANTQFQQQQQAERLDQEKAMNRANQSLIASRIAANNWEIAHEQKMAFDADLTAHANLMKMIDDSKDEGGYVVGTYRTFDEAMEAFKRDEAMHGHHAEGQLIPVTNVGPDGTAQGVTVGFVPKPWKDRKATEDYTVDYPTGEFDKQGNPITKKMTVGKSTGDTNDKVQTFQMDAADKLSKMHLDQIKEKREAAVAAADINYKNAMAEKARNSGTLGQLGDMTPAQKTDVLDGLATGRYLMNRDFPIRTPKDRETALQLAAEANQHSMQTYGLPYDPETIRQESHQASDLKTQGFFVSADALLGTNGQPGLLDDVLTAAEQAGLGNKGFGISSVYQHIKQWGNLDPATATLMSKLSDVQSKLGPLQGNPLLGGGESDKKIGKAEQQLGGTNLTYDNLKAEIQNAKDVLNKSRDRALKGNRFLQRREGVFLGPAAGGGSPEAGTGGTAGPAAPGAPQGGRPTASQPVKINPGDQVKYDQATGDPYVVRGNQWVKAQR